MALGAARLFLATASSLLVLASCGGKGGEGPDGGSVTDAASKPDGGPTSDGPGGGDGVSIVAIGAVDGQGDADIIGAFTLDATNLYWAEVNSNTGHGMIRKVPLAGGTPVTIANILASAIAVDATNLYWCDDEAFQVVKMPLAGGPMTTLAATAPYPSAMAVDGTNVYWGTLRSSSGGGPQTSSIAMVPIAGGTPTTLATSTSYDVVGIAVSANELYATTSTLYVSPGTAMLLQVPLSGGMPTTLESTTGAGGQVAVDASSVYWNRSAGASPATYNLLSAPLAGGTPTTLASGSDAPSSFTIDGATLYATNATDSTVVAMPLAGGATTTIVSGASTPAEKGPGEIRASSTDLYWETSNALLKRSKAP